MENSPMRFFGRKKPESAVQNFEVKPELEALVAELEELSKTGTGISLDHDGFFPEQIQAFYDRMIDITQNHGEELLTYLQPYANLTVADKQKLDYAGYARLNALTSLPDQIA